MLNFLFSCLPHPQKSFGRPVTISSIMGEQAGRFNFCTVASYPGKAVGETLVSSLSVFGNGRPSVVHFYNGG